jgi:hypothetical protein
VVTVRPEAKPAFEKVMRGVVMTPVGTTGGSHIDVELLAKKISLTLRSLTGAYRKPFQSW